MFEGKRVVVTGAAGALGQAVFQHFADLGARLVALDYSDDLLGTAFPDQTGSGGKNAEACRCARRRLGP